LLGESQAVGDAIRLYCPAAFSNESRFIFPARKIGIIDLRQIIPVVFGAG
jgi:hypothetical protein